MVALEKSQEINKVKGIHPLGTTNKCIKVHGNLCNICFSLHQSGGQTNCQIPYIFCVLSRSCINTKKSMRQSSLVRVKKVNLMQNTEEEPQNQSNLHWTGCASPTWTKRGEKASDDFSKYQRLLAIHAESNQFHETKPANMRKKEKQVEIQRVSSIRS